MYYPQYKNGIRYTFTLQCPNLDNLLTLSLFHDATVHGDIHYHDVCKVADTVNIAYNNIPDIYEVDHDNQTVLKEPPIEPMEGWSNIPFDWEIIQPFLDHYSLTATWIDCNYTWGRLDEETGTWTGALGKVRNCNLYTIYPNAF